MKTVVITGISRGIGLATAALFLEKKWQVIGTSTTGHTPLMHANLKIHPLNLASSGTIVSFVNELPQIDLLINNAAILLEHPNEDQINLQQLKATFDVNVFGTIELTEGCIAKFNPGAQIVNISSGWGAFSSNDSAFQPHYKMSKACLNMYTILLTERLPSIRVSSFDPGWVKTDMGTKQANKAPAEVAQELYALVSDENKPSGFFWARGKIRAW